MTSGQLTALVTLLAAILAAGVGVLNLIANNRRERITRAKTHLPSLVTEFWAGAHEMWLEMESLRDCDDIEDLEDGERVGMRGFTAMSNVVSRMELEAPADIVYKAIIYQDACDAVRMDMLSAETVEERRRVFSQHRHTRLSTHAAEEEFLNACRREMRLDAFSTAGLNQARKASLAVHPEIERKHKQALSELHEEMDSRRASDAK